MHGAQLRPRRRARPRRADRGGRRRPPAHGRRAADAAARCSRRGATRSRRILEAWYPGQNGGTAIARVLFGDAEPGGRLPATFPLREADEPTAGDPETYPGVAERSLQGGRPHRLPLVRRAARRRVPVRLRALLHDASASATCAVGQRGAATARACRSTWRTPAAAPARPCPQLYVGMPGRAGPRPAAAPAQGLRKLALSPGRRARVRSRSTSARSPTGTRRERWRVAPGCYRIGVGQSSRDLPGACGSPWAARAAGAERSWCRAAEGGGASRSRSAGRPLVERGRGL